MRLSAAKALLEKALDVYVYVLLYKKPQGHGMEKTYFRVTKREAGMVLDEIDHGGEDPEVHATYEHQALYIGALPR